MQTGPKALASRAPSHFAGGCGGRQRRSPTGGAAYGTPLKTRTPGTELETPSSRPLSTRAVLSSARVEEVRGASNNKQQHRPKIFIIAFSFFMPARRFPSPVITHMKSSRAIVRPETVTTGVFFSTGIRMKWDTFTARRSISKAPTVFFLIDAALTRLFSSVAPVMDRYHCRLAGYSGKVVTLFSATWYAVICFERIAWSNDKPHPQQIIHAQTPELRSNRSSRCSAGVALLRAIRPQPALRLLAER